MVTIEEFCAKNDRKKLTSEITSSTTFDSLDNYSLAHIFSFLPWKDKCSMQQVSKKCKSAMEIIWSRIRVFESSERSTDAQARLIDHYRENYLLLHCGKYLRKYKRLFEFPITTQCLKVLRRDCRNLTYLEFSTYFHHKHYFFNAFTDMEKLKTIKIRILKGKCNNDDVYDTRILESVTRNVEEIKLQGYEGTIGLAKQFARILEEFKSLTSLGIICWTLERSVTRVISQERSLKHLSLKGCTFIADDLIISNLKNLESLNISWAFPRKPDELRIFKSITTHPQHVKSLGISTMKNQNYGS